MNNENENGLMPIPETSNLNAVANAAITVLDDEIAKARQQYCYHSGKPLQKIPALDVDNLITIHGRETALKILLSQQRQTSLEWIWLNDEGLSNLALHNVKEYFVYTSSLLFQDVTLHNELMRLHECANAWENLQSIDESLLTPINELMRRLLAGWKRKTLNGKLTRFKIKRIDLITADLSSIIAYQLELDNLIKSLYDKQKRNKAMQDGMTNFRLQKMITALSSLELSIGRELNDFDLISGKNADCVDAIVGRKYGHEDNKKKAKQIYATTPTKKTGGFTLKFGGGK